MLGYFNQMNLNKVYVLGRVTADPEVRTTPSGERVTSFSVATNRVWNDKAGARKESTEFHNIVLWGRQADVAGQFLTKGGLVLVEGRLQTRAYQGKDGIQRKVTEIVGERIQLGPRSAGNQSKDNTNQSHDNNYQEVPIIEVEDSPEIKPEDLPF